MDEIQMIDWAGRACKQLVISKQSNAAMLAEALCKLEGFVYAPSETIYWQHVHST